jgi:hypothetical protein
MTENFGLEKGVYLSPDTGKGGEVENGKSYRSFREMLNEARFLVENPNPEREKSLRMERARLIRDAKDAGVFDTLKKTIAEIQSTYDFNNAGKKIKSIDVRRLEQEAGGLPGWDERFEGLLEEYRYLALMNMGLAYLRVISQGDAQEAKKLERSIEVRGWGMPPTNLEMMALKYVESLVEKPEKQGDDFVDLLKRFTPEAFARAMGQASPETQMNLYLLNEENMLVRTETAISQIPNFLLDESISLEEREKLQKEWRARSQLLNAVVNKRTAPSYENLFPNTEAQELTGEQLAVLMNMRGVIEATSLHLVNIVGMGDDQTGRDIRDYEILNPKYDNTNPSHKSERNIKTIFGISTGEQLALYREKVRKILVERGLTYNEARDAEHVAWNLIYLSNVFEEFDREGVSTVSQLKSQAVWMMMHPQKRLENKAQAGESWGIFGEWFVYQKRRDSNFSKSVLPETMFRNALREIKFNNNRSLFDVLLENGKRLAENTKATITDAKQLPWGVVESPFGGYYFGLINPAIQVFKAISSKPGEKVDLIGLGNALRGLGVGVEYRIHILMAYNGIKHSSADLKPIMGKFDWNIYLQQLKKSVPSFFN